MYRLDGIILTAIDPTTMVKVNGLSQSASTAERRYTKAQLATAGLYLEYREPDRGDGWYPPRVGTNPDGEPVAFIGAIVKSAEEIGSEAHAWIINRARELQDLAAGAYGWPEAAAWTPLEAQARAYLADPTAPIGIDLAHDVGDLRDATSVEARAISITQKANLFREARGNIVRWRRETLADLETALADQEPAETIRSLWHTAIEDTAAGIPVMPPVIWPDATDPDTPASDGAPAMPED
jgi:hypothetical protein